MCEETAHEETAQRKRLIQNTPPNCVYHIKCSCGASYVGHTERNVYLRMAENSKTSGVNLSTVGRHLSENPDHTVDFEPPDVLGYSLLSVYCQNTVY